LAEPIVQLHKVTKKYRLGNIEIDSLDIDDLRIEKGAFIAIMGPSGSGKSTLLNIIGGLDSPTTGEVIVGGMNIAEMSQKNLARLRREKIGFIFQFFNLIPTLTAIENVELPMVFQGRLSRKEARDRAKNLLELVKLADRMNHRPKELSGGQQQRVAIARALMNDPVLVLADEPTGNIDSATGSEIVQLMRSLNQTRNQTFLIVTHDPKIAASAERVLYIVDGRIGSSSEAGRIKPSDRESGQAAIQLIASELESLRESIKRIRETKDELPVEFYQETLSLYERRIRKLTEMLGT